MNIYQKINEITAYLEDHLDDHTDYHFIATKMGTNLYTARKIFALLTDLSISEYIRLRRLSKAAYDLQRGAKAIDVATKYQYDSPASFSRAFKSFHGVNPSQVTKNTPLKNFPRLVLKETLQTPAPEEYTYIEKPSFTLYGFSTPTDFSHISTDAPNFFSKITTRYAKQYGHPIYGMVTYSENRKECLAYSVLYTDPIPRSNPVTFPASAWLVFRISSQNASDIQAQSQEFYRDFLPSCAYNLMELPELEYYHDNITDFLVPVEKTDKNTH